MSHRLRSFTFLVGLILISSSVATQASAQPSRDIDTYTLFAYHQLRFKGENVGDTGNILGGNVGVNFESSDPNAVELSFGNPAFMSVGTQVVAHHVRIDSGSFIWDLFANQTSSGFNPSVVHGTGPTPYTTPIIAPADLPVLPAFSPGVTDIDINGAPAVLPPGSYRAVTVRDDNVLTLQAGIYNLASVRLGKRATLNTVDGTIVRIKKDLFVSNGAKILGSDLAKFLVESEGVKENDRTVSFGRVLEIHGQFFAPNGNLNLGHGNNMFGRFWAGEINSDFNDNVTYRAPESVSGKKFRDDDGDGSQGGSEPNLAGITFYVDYNDNGVLDPGEPSAVSDANGDWKIPEVNTGTYKIRETGIGTFICTTPAPSCFYTITFSASGQDHGGNVFGNKPTTQLPDSVSGKKFVDENNDGILTPGEPPLAGVVFFVDYNDNGVLDSPAEPSAVSDALGNWSIPMVSVGTFKVREVGVPGYTCTLPAPVCEYTVTFGSTGQNHGGNDFGNAPPDEPNPDSASGNVFFDKNCNGLFDDAIDPPLGGVTVFLDCNSNGSLDGSEQSTASDLNGNWNFIVTTQGSCDIRTVAPSGFVCSFPGGCSYTVTFNGTGTNHAGNVFGFTPSDPVSCTTDNPESVSGIKFLDVNGDGQQNAGETGLAGTLFYVDYNDNSVLDPGEPSATSNSTGAWLITNVNPGVAKVREVLTSAFICTVPAGTCSYTIPFGSSGVEHTGNVFGNTSSVCDETVNGANCVNDKCDQEDNIDSILAVDGNGFRLFQLTTNAVNLSQKLKRQKRSCQGLSKKKRAAVLTEAQNQYLALWNVAHDDITRFTFSCSEPAPTVCVAKSFEGVTGEAVARNVVMVNNINSALTRCAKRSTAGKRIQKNAKAQVKKTNKALSELPKNTLVCETPTKS